MSVSPSTYRLSQYYAVVNHDDKTACRGSSVIEDPEEFYSMIFDNYINQDIGNVLHYLDVVPSNHEKTYRRLWFDLDYHSTNKSEVEALYNNELVNRMIMKLCTVSTKYFNMNEKDLCIVTARKPVSPKEYKDGPAFSFGMHVYTNMFVKGEYLTQLYNLLSADNEIRFYTRQLHVNFNEFVDKSVIGNPHKNNGCMFLGCSKDESLSGYKLYQSNYFIGNWFQIDDTNCDTCRSYFNQTLLNYPSPIDKFVDFINVDLFDNLQKNNHTNRYIKRLSNATKEEIKNAFNMNDIKEKNCIVPDVFIDDIHIQHIKKCYDLLITIENGKLFDNHDSWFKICAATKQLCNNKEAFKQFAIYSTAYGHHRDDNYIKKTWDDMKCDCKDSANYIMLTLLNNNLLSINDKDNYIYMVLLKRWKMYNTIDPKTIIDLFQLYEFNDTYAVYSSFTDFKLYRFDDQNVLRRIPGERDNQEFENRLSTFLDTLHTSLKRSMFYEVEVEYSTLLEKKMKSSIIQNINNFKEWKTRYLTDYGIPYYNFNKQYMVHKEKHVYTQMGFIVPEDPHASPRPIHYDLIPYKKSDMVFEDMIVAAKYIPNWYQDEEGRKAVDLFDTHINRYCEFCPRYAKLMKKILTSAFYTKTDSTIAYILYGSTGANGKTVTTDLLASMVGDKQCIVVNPDNLDENSVSPKLIDMSNKLMYYMNELVDEDTSGKKRTYNPFNSRIFKEIAEKKKGVTARKLFSNVYNDINYTGVLFITSNVQPTAINASPIARRVCFLPSCCRFFPEGSNQLYEFKYKHGESFDKQIPEKVLKPNHYEMDPSIKYTFEKYKDYIFSYLIQTYLFESTLLTAGELEEEEHIAACKAKFFERSAEGYEIKQFVNDYISIDPFQINVITLEEIFKFYKKINEKNSFTIKKDIEKFGNAFFGCLTSIPEFACIDIVNIDRPYEEPYYQNGFTHGIRGILLDHAYKSNINMVEFCKDHKIKCEPLDYTDPEYPYKHKRRLVINDFYDYFP